MKQKTNVLFLIDKNEEWPAFAYFPNEHYYHSEHPDYNKTFSCYAHVGQHSACSSEFMNECVQANYNEYQDLLQELISIGYDPTVLNDQQIECSRKPTEYEIKFGHGATHYREFKIGDILKRNGKLKKWFVADDGLRYYRK